MIASKPRLGVVLVNWNRWQDTTECLESLLRSDVPLRIVVVDNDSADGSADRIMAWAAGQEMAPVASPDMAAFSAPPLPKPIACVRVSRAEAENGIPDVPLVLVDSGGNLGFAGGNNVGLRLLRHDPAIEYFWLLNNDTVVAPDAARSLLATMAATWQVGMCGTVVRFYWRPEVRQVLNGYRFNKWTGGARGIGAGTAATAAFDARKVAQDTDFVMGASIAVSREFLDVVGQMEERYFLYFEEIDWATRNDGRLTTAFAKGATIFHKEGGSIGSASGKGARSVMADYWLNRSRLSFVRLHHPLLLPVHWLFTLALIGRRLLRRQPAKAAAIWRALMGRPYLA